MRAREQGSMGSKGFNTTQKIEFYFFIICFPFKKSVHKPLSILPLAMFLVPRSKFSFQISSRRFLEGPFCLWQCFQFPDPDSVFQLSLLESVGFLLPIPSFPPSSAMPSFHIHPRRGRRDDQNIFCPPLSCPAPSLPHLQCFVHFLAPPPVLGQHWWVRRSD